ncbi:Aldo/keto reductase [Stereum hirsutum FP-91666 SS1]|uniref:Aldo/keto reductase n=1 Tax=Stereum hirsutum (strain FP-91666) TaxID=721885 RepID=UPI000440AAE6|nr:Aldo/keto reductase [Stereum hirsutum FP-91666 SS1]EIM87501.1 Aldo/keto reductase [Stereum hirsutum FP-91666 SS1]
MANRRVPYVRVGNSGLKVSKLVLGCMSYGSPEWSPWVLEEEEAIKHIKAAYDAGIQSFDTSNVYSNGLSEVILGKAIKQLNLPREEIVVMTKLCAVVGRTPSTPVQRRAPAQLDADGYVNQYGLSRKNIFASVKASLERLQLDYIDLYWCHRFDYNTPIEETMQALHDIVKAGYVRYIGMSSCYAYQFHAMQNYAITHNLTPFIAMQNHYNVVYREEEREMMPTLKHFGVGSIPWSPLARGAVTRPIDAEKTARATGDQLLKPDAYLADGTGGKDIVRRVEELAKKHGATMPQVALAWTMAKDVVSAPIIGTTSLEKLEDLLGAFDVKLSEEDIKYLEEPYTPLRIIGHI